MKYGRTMRRTNFPATCSASLSLPWPARS